VKNLQNLMTESKELSASYRKSRNILTLFCGLGLAYSAAQFEVKSLELGFLGNVIIENSAVPIIIGGICLYGILRTTLDFMMQSKLVRRWRLAQTDYKITTYLFRVTFFSLIISTLFRDWKTIILTISIIGLGIICFVILLGFCWSICIPFEIYRRKEANGPSAAVKQAFYSGGILAFILSITAITAFPLLQKPPFIFFSKTATSNQLWLFAIAAISIIVLFIFDSAIFRKVFAHEPKFIEKQDENKVISYELNPKHPEHETFKEEE
jgi:hypothetical protein